MGSDCRMGALAGRGERPSSQVLTICTGNYSVDIPPQPNTPPGRAHAPEGQRCPGLLLPTRKSWAACPGQQKSGGVWWQLRPKVEMRGRRGLRPRSRDRGGEPALRTALLRSRGRGCRAVGQRASGAEVQWAPRGGWFPQGRTKDGDCEREPSLARKFNSAGAGPPRACLRSRGRTVSVPGLGRLLCGRDTRRARCPLLCPAPHRVGSGRHLSCLGLPVSRVHQLRAQAEFLEALVAHHDDNGGGRGRDDSS